MTKVTVSKRISCSGHRDCVYALAGSDHQHFYSSGGDGMVVQWDLDDPDKGELLAQVPTSVYSLKPTNDGRQLIIGQNFEGIQVLDLDAKKISGSLKLADAAMFFIEELEGKFLVGLKTGEILVIDQKTLTVNRKLHDSSLSARSLSLNPTKNEFAVGFSDHKVRVYDSRSFALIKEIPGHSNSVFAVQYSPDGKYLISGGRDAHLKVWNTHEYEEETSIVAHMYAINDIAFSPNGKHFVTCSMDKSIKVWDYSTFNLIKVIDKSRHAGHGTSVNKLFWSPYNEQLISCSDDRTISLWDLEFS